VVAVLAGSAFADDDALYYEVHGRALVITNTPSALAKPLPSWDGRPESLPSADRLPATAFDAAIGRAARAAGISKSLVKAVAWAESGFDPRAVSPKGALGLMQLMPRTAASYGVTNPFDPEQNLRAGATHLRNLLREFDGDLTLTLAAYNAGAGTVRRHGGVPNFRETRNYVSKVRSRVSATKLVREEPVVRRTVAPSSGSSLRLLRGADGSVSIEN